MKSDIEIARSIELERIEKIAEKAGVPVESINNYGKNIAKVNEKLIDEEKIKKIMMVIPQMIDDSVPIGPDDSCNVEVQRFGDATVPEFEIPYHTEIMERFDGIDMDAAGRVAGNGFYYLVGDIARLHEGIIAYARDFMIGKGFTYCIPPFMIRSSVVTGVMSFAEMENMMYKIEGEDLYLIGTSEHSMIGRYIDQMIDEETLPQTLTSYSPCFRKEKGAHGIEERGVYRIHQFEKQEMIVICKPEDSMMWFDKLWKNAPTAIEMEHYGFVHAHNDHFRDGLTAIEAFKRCHATFAGFHGYPRKWLENEFYLTEYCANRLGYWYFITGACIPELTDTAYNIITLDMENRGWARAYWPYDLKLRLKNEEGSYIIPLDADNREWLPDNPFTIDLRVDARGVPAGEYDVSIGLFEGERPIKLAIKETALDEGFYTIGRTAVRTV